MKTTTPMKKLTHNLTILKNQLKTLGFLMTELSQSSSVNEDYIIIFEKCNINFAFTFWYKDLEESSCHIDITTKKEGKIEHINTLSYSKFKICLNNLVQMDFTNSNDLYQYILLLKNINDDIVIKQKNSIEEFELSINQLAETDEYKNNLELLKKVIIIDNKIYGQYTNSEEYKEVQRLQKQLIEATTNLENKKKELLSEHKDLDNDIKTLQKYRSTLENKFLNVFNSYKEHKSRNFVNQLEMKYYELKKSLLLLKRIDYKIKSNFIK